MLTGNDMTTYYTTTWVCNVIRGYTVSRINLPTGRGTGASSALMCVQCGMEGHGGRIGLDAVDVSVYRMSRAELPAARDGGRACVNSSSVWY